MIKTFLIFLVLCGCATQNRLNSLSGVAKVEHVKKQSVIKDVQIEESKEQEPNKKRTIIFFLSKETSLCIPELILLKNVDVRFSQIRSIYLLKYFQEKGSEWNRFYLVEKSLKANNKDYSIIKNQDLKIETLQKYYFRLRSVPQKLSELEQSLLNKNQKAIKKLGKVNLRKEDIIFVSDISLKRFLKIKPLKDLNSFLRIKKQCESISNELNQKLNTSV